MKTTIEAPVLTTEQLALLPDEDDVQFYREHGYYHSKKLFTDEQIDAAVRAQDDYYAGIFPNGYPPELERFCTSVKAVGMRKNDYSSFCQAGLAVLAQSPIVGAVAARLSGSPQIRLWHDQLLMKPVEEPGKAANVGWHTDYGYWKTCSSPAMITAWIPFHDCDEVTGSITMVDGSNSWPDNTQALDFFSNDLEGLEKKFNTGGKPVVKHVMKLKKGEVSFHHCLTIHGSGPNRSDHPRRSIAVHMQDAENRYRRTLRPDGTLFTHYNDTLVRKLPNGDPDYTDPRWCPVLYTQG